MTAIITIAIIIIIIIIIIILLLLLVVLDGGGGGGVWILYNVWQFQWRIQQIKHVKMGLE